ncbi:MAG TPA: hypothetical protein VFL59_05770 [Candidatus Nanopelagicales bacterium]|nr:hypothetical protein [Candidatus Nanopelagicales bacterium]
MVGGAGLIYAVIIGMWALVLVPMWLRRHDEAQESKSADRFARAMGTLRRGSSDGTRSSLPVREVLMPRRPSGVHDTEVVVKGSAPAASPAADAAARRRRVLAVLVGLLVVWTVVVVLHRAPTWSLVVPTALVVGFLVVARRQVALAADIRRRQQRRATLADAAREAESRYAGGSAARRGGRVVDPAPVRTADPVSVPAARAAEPVAAEGSWSAVPTTLPTYVTAPPATRVPRVIDLTTPGSWSGAAMVEKARETLAAEPVAEGAMRVESFEIAVPRDPQVRAGVYEEPAAPAARPAASRDSRYRDSSYADRYVTDGSEIEALAAEEDDLDSLLGDPRTGVHGPTWRRAANG